MANEFIVHVKQQGEIETTNFPTKDDAVDYALYRTPGGAAVMVTGPDNKIVYVRVPRSDSRAKGLKPAH
ncbi:MAG TPA: hypothetical protein VJ302_21055 [Blastocatellia bacterium]|nr:hypothetical protein [Blastocatellia bacterium]